MSQFLQLPPETCVKFCRAGRDKIPAGLIPSDLLSDVPRNLQANTRIKAAFMRSLHSLLDARDNQFRRSDRIRITGDFPGEFKFLDTMPNSILIQKCLQRWKAELTLRNRDLAIGSPNPLDSLTQDELLSAHWVTNKQTNKVIAMDWVLRRDTPKSIISQLRSLHKLMSLLLTSLRLSLSLQVSSRSKISPWPSIATCTQMSINSRS